MIINLLVVILLLLFVRSVLCCGKVTINFRKRYMCYILKKSVAVLWIFQLRLQEIYMYSVNPHKSYEIDYFRTFSEVFMWRAFY